mmetsp:Transcript_53553/g.100379  ORF Transcript_53553/g.100379 Transcript_53553/m.100379 type:complete len:201 (-) Transcript_53553:108-710(-)
MVILVIVLLIVIELVDELLHRGFAQLLDCVLELFELLVQALLGDLQECILQGAPQIFVLLVLLLGLVLFCGSSFISLFILEQVCNGLLDILVFKHFAKATLPNLFGAITLDGRHNFLDQELAQVFHEFVLLSCSTLSSSALCNVCCLLRELCFLRVADLFDLGNLVTEPFQDLLLDVFIFLRLVLRESFYRLVPPRLTTA